DLKNNATLTAMLAYLASEDPETVARDRRTFDHGATATPSAGPFGGNGPTAWPTCTESLRNSSLYKR
ncbi:MAG: hypothetical protein ABIT38_18965, partial [Gemmatimonadaceae bacterium]